MENIRWVKGTARPGKYQVFVQNYSHHEQHPADIPFKVELEIDGKVETFSSVAKKGITGPQSDISAFKFTYSPDAAVVASAENREAYTDEVILGKWRTCIPDGHIIRLSDAKWTTEAAIGIMAIQSGAKTLTQVLKDMHERAVKQEGIDEVERALKSFSTQAVVEQVDESAFS